MSEIKFRAWVFGDLDEGANPFMADVYAIVFEPEGPCVQWEEFDEISCPGEFALMQCTGLKDKNGKEIYEGDILSFHHCYADPQNPNDTIDEIRTFVMEWHRGDEWSGFSFIGPVEIVGNIYENPELVKHG
jgi:hypothetical protein